MLLFLFIQKRVKHKKTTGNCSKGVGNHHHGWIVYECALAWAQTPNAKDCTLQRNKADLIFNKGTRLAMCWLGGRWSFDWHQDPQQTLQCRSQQNRVGLKPAGIWKGWPLHGQMGLNRALQAGKETGSCGPKLGGSAGHWVHWQGQEATASPLSPPHTLICHVPSFLCAFE